MQWFRVPPKIYFKRGSVDLALKELDGKNRAFIITDRFLFNSGAIKSVIKILDEINISHQIFFEVKPDPSISTVEQALSVLKPYEPDVIIAVGGGSVMDVAKTTRLMYEYPKFNQLDIPKYISLNGETFPNIINKSTLVCIPTTSGSGSEVTPFAVIKDKETNQKYAIIDYSLTPDMAIVDANFVDNMPKGLTSASGLDALSHAIEAYTSNMGTNFTNSNALEAIKLVFRYLPRSVKNGKDDPVAREKIHYASTLAGMAFANSFVSLCHHMALKLGGIYNLPTGAMNAILITHVIKYKTTHSNSELKYTEKYAQIADELNLGGNSDIEKTELLTKEINTLLEKLELPKSLKAYGIQGDEFRRNLNNLANTLYEELKNSKILDTPSIDDIEQIYSAAYEEI